MSQQPIDDQVRPVPPGELALPDAGAANDGEPVAALSCVVVASRASAPRAVQAVGLLASRTAIRIVAVLHDQPDATRRVEALRPDLVFVAPDVSIARWTAAQAGGACGRPTVIAVPDAAAPPLNTPDPIAAGNGPRYLSADVTGRVHAPPAPLAAGSRRIAIRNGNWLVVLRDDDIDWLRAEGEHVAVHSNGTVRFVSRSLAAFERVLDPARFVRIHLHLIVRFDLVREIHPLFHGDQEAVLRDGTRLPMHRGYYRRFLNLTHHGADAG